jgi:hypothetical protein
MPSFDVISYVLAKRALQRTSMITTPKLSDIIIDVDKDWQGYKIKNLGSPVDANDAIRKSELDAHRNATPLDHPDLSITRSKLEYPTVNVNFTYLSAINKTRGVADYNTSYFLLTYDSFADKAVFAFTQVNDLAKVAGRVTDRNNAYWATYNPSAKTADNKVEKRVAGTVTTIAREAIDIDNSGRGLAISCSGSTLKSLRYELTTPIDPISLPTPDGVASATDTSFASGYFGFRPLRETYSHGGSESGSAWLKDPLTPIPPAQAILELDVEGSGSPEDPFRPSVSENLVEIISLTGLPDFLYQEAIKYKILKSKGFTDDEMRLVFGYVPQHQVDLDSVTWGAFEFNPHKSPTVIVTITGDNPYKSGAVDRQRAKSKKAFNTPSSYDEAVVLYKHLKKDHHHWLAGVHSWCYQIFGHEFFDWLQNVDFYYGELIEHKTHHLQLKLVPDYEIRNRLNELIDKLSKTNILIDERDKHIVKAKEILKKGW